MIICNRFLKHTNYIYIRTYLTSNIARFNREQEPMNALDHTKCDISYTAKLRINCRISLPRT